MKKLTEWQYRHGISTQAMIELTEILGLLVPIPEHYPEAAKSKSETAVQIECRLKASDMGGRLWRNNVGVAKRDDGTPVRYGLCNESKQMNQIIKSHDLIGIRPIMITSNHVGSFIGQFWSREVKKSSWKFTGTPRELAQFKFGQLVNDLGGDAQFINDSEQLK